MKNVVLLTLLINSIQTYSQEYDSIASDGEKFIKVEESAQFPGGLNEWTKYLKKNLKYPKEARRNNITGRVFLKFVVDEEGSVTNIKVLRSLGYGCDKEAIRLLSETPKWIPAKANNKPVRQKMLQNLLFRPH
ncbi:MAG: energy transducer TonB [Bacteroidota bacterium]